MDSRSKNLEAFLNLLLNDHTCVAFLGRLVGREVDTRDIVDAADELGLRVTMEAVTKGRYDGIGFDEPDVMPHDTKLTKRQLVDKVNELLGAEYALKLECLVRQRGWTEHEAETKERVDAMAAKLLEHGFRERALEDLLVRLFKGRPLKEGDRD